MSDKKIYFIHQPKCAGSTIVNFINGCNNPNWITFSGGDHHHRLNETDKLNFANGDCYISNVRNPFTFYASLFTFESFKQNRRLKRRGKKTFAQDWQLDYSLKVKAFKDWMIKIHLPENLPEVITKYNFGVFTHSVIRYWFLDDPIFFKNEFYENHNENYVISDFMKVESLKTDIERIFSQESISLPVKNKSRGFGSISKDENYMDLYDSELIDLVETRDDYIFRKFY
jgi:hypothetical protein